MRVVEVTKTGGPDVLQIGERADPLAGPGEAVVRVRRNPVALTAR